MRVFVLLNNADLIIGVVAGKRKLYGKTIRLLKLFINANIAPTHVVKTFVALSRMLFFQFKFIT